MPLPGPLTPGDHNVHYDDDDYYDDYYHDDYYHDDYDHALMTIMIRVTERTGGSVDFTSMHEFRASLSS